MRRLVITISLMALITGCSTVDGAISLINPVQLLNTGVGPLLIIGELETNLTSLVVDKTKATIVDFDVKPFEILPEKSIIYVVPASITKHYEKVFDHYYSDLVKRYLLMNNFAVVTDDISKADFVLVTSIAESPERNVGTNFSAISVSIMQLDERAVFFSNIKIRSKSDKNFYYHPTKSARPVAELTLAGFEKIFRDGLPQAFGSERR